MSLYISEDCNKIHLLFSGGADSTILLYLLLLEQQKKPELEIKCYGLMMPKLTIKFSRCISILNVLEQRFKTKIIFKNFDKQFILREFAQLILSVEPGYVYSGCNKVLEFLEPINYIEGDTPPVRGHPFNEFHIRPFINMDKAEIISYYIQHNVLDLLNMTHSCGYDMETPCNGCYFCLERGWGLQKCGITL
jgi:7-cyano-7-deazaguanine synthase in queuosine biosynthesis